MQRALAALVVVFLLLAGLAAVGQTEDVVEEVFLAKEAIDRAANGICRNNPEHHRCASTTSAAPSTTAEPTTSQAPTTTQLVTTTTTLPPTTTTTQAPTTTQPPTTTAPTSCIGVQVAAGSNLVNVANAQPAGTTFCLAAGTYQVDAPIPFQSGDRWIGSLGASGARQSLLTGRDITQYLVTATSSNVLLQNVIVERFNNALQQGVNTGAQTFWTFDNVEVRENAAHGIHLHNNSKIINSFVHHNHQMGLGGNGDNTLVENTEVANNNYLHETDVGWEGGGSKFVHANGTVVRNSNFHDNCGPGIWFDGLQNQNNVIEGNTVIRNAGAGIFYELANGPAVIRNNYVEGNALGIDNNPACTHQGNIFGIYVSDSTNVEVHNNTLVNNDGGIGSQQSDRKQVSNVLFHDNDVTLTQGWSGFRCNNGSDCSLAFPVRFENNHYHVPTLAGDWFNWKHVFKDWNEWRALGHDDTGSIAS